MSCFPQGQCGGLAAAYGVTPPCPHGSGSRLRPVLTHATAVLARSIAYIYKAKKEIDGSKFRCIWGKITRAHGNNGVVRTKFRKNLPPCSIAGPCRVMLYPSRV